MSDTFSWTCPFCEHAAIITSNESSFDTNYFNAGPKHGWMALVTQVVVCPNSRCREYSLTVLLYTAIEKAGQFGLNQGKGVVSLRPRSKARQFPDYIPQTIRQDYEEACLIRDLSPKASATLSRRCLQGMIRDFWGISKSRLIDEVNDLQGKVDSTTWQAIDAVRSIGNIGAHMEKDISLILEVEPKEAQLLTELIEILLHDWYIVRQQRQEHLSSIISAAEAKKLPKDEHLTGEPGNEVQ